MTHTDFEPAICDILPGHGAIMGGMKGPIQTREDFDQYPWSEIPIIFKKEYTPHFESIRKTLPPGMKAYGGCGYGIFDLNLLVLETPHKIFQTVLEQGTLFREKAHGYGLGSGDFQSPFLSPRLKIAGPKNRVKVTSYPFPKNNPADFRR